MGIYVEATGSMSKIDRIMQVSLDYHDSASIENPREYYEQLRKQDKVPIAVMNNGMFVAAGVCYCLSEFMAAVVNINDTREKIIFEVYECDLDYLLDDRQMDAYRAYSKR